MHKPICIGCNKPPAEIDEYIDAVVGTTETEDEYVRAEEGTYNPRNGHFLCTKCYVKAGMPSSPNGWVAP